MDTINKLHSEEDFSSDRKYQTSSNNMTNTIQNILNNHFQQLNTNKTNNIPKKRVINSIDSKTIQKNIKGQTSFIQKLDSNKIPKASPYTFKYFYNIANRRKQLFNSSLGSNSIKEKNHMESNFINLSKNANIYTKNAEYIQNKKMLLFDKNDFDNYKYKPDRANIFDMTNIPQSRNRNSTLYKTTIFRGGKLYFKKKENNKNSDKIKHIDKIKNFKNNVKNKFYENMPIDNMIEFIDQNKEKLFQVIRRKNIVFGDDSKEKEKKAYKPYDSLYKKLMTKKDEILDTLINNNINEYNKNKILIPLQNHQRSVSNFNNSSVMNPQNSSIDSNYLNNSTNKLNNSTYKLNNSTIKLNSSNNNKFNNSSKNITNLSGYSNLLSKRNKDGIPVIFPIVCSTFAKCNSVSQSSRYQNIMDNFIKIKTLIENDKSLGKDNEFEYIKEFLINKQIDQKHITPNNLINFSKFLKCEKLPIDLNKSLKDNIIIALYYDENKYKFYSQINYNEKADYSKTINKYYKNKLLLPHNKKRNNHKSLDMDLSRQKKLYNKEEYNSDYELNNELKKELFLIENEIQNKQNIIKQVEKNINLSPLYYNYYNNIRNKNKNQKKNKSIELRLASTQEINKSKFIKSLKGKKKLNINGNIYDSNERLYYSWYRDKNKGNINNFVKKSKLTEFVMYNRTKEKIMYGNFDDFFRNNSIE